MTSSPQQSDVPIPSQQFDSKSNYKLPSHQPLNEKLTRDRRRNLTPPCQEPLDDELMNARESDGNYGDESPQQLR